jgi:hypothetical protein
MARPISKSRFLAGLQCRKRLWLEAHRRDLIPEDPARQARFDLGNEVGELARQLYPEGRLIEARFDRPSQALAATAAAVQAGSPVLFEAAAQAGGGFARADILKRSAPGENLWDMLEVKSTAQAKENHLPDLAMQRRTFEAAGFPIRSTSIVHLNRDYVRSGDLELGHLFAISDQTRAVTERLEAVPGLLAEFAQVLEQPVPPEPGIGRHCDEPYECPFKAHCWKEVPEGSVFELAKLRTEKALEFYRRGIRLVAEIPEEETLTESQRRQVAAAKSGQPFYDREALRGFLEGLGYPLYYLDFETVNPALPLWDGNSPFEHVPFQYSLEVQDSPGSMPRHAEYLFDPEAGQLPEYGQLSMDFGDAPTGKRSPASAADPREELAGRLVEDLGTQGTILAFNAAFESSVLKDLAARFGRYRTRLEAVIPRVVDLANPFLKGWVVHPGFKGSTSLKVVLPALVPGMSYAGLAIGQGLEASNGLQEMLKPGTSLGRRAEIRKALLEYCGQDTRGMVEIVAKLRAEVKGS